MTAAIVPALIESNTARGSSAADIPTVNVAGTQWPVHKAHALAAAVVMAVLVLLVTESGQVAMWASAITMVVTWWGERAFFAARRTSARH
ncbi:hypothetical protein ACWDTI_05835 [Gordonia sp. NPDC003424]